MLFKLRAFLPLLGFLVGILGTVVFKRLRWEWTHRDWKGWFALTCGCDAVGRIFCHRTLVGPGEPILCNCSCHERKKQN